MKVIIAGSRGITRYSIVEKAVIASKFLITQVVSGGARGVDRLGIKWAKRNDVPFTVMPAAWMSLDGGRNMQAGFERNVRMADYADALIAVWDGFSGGTKHMMQCMGKRAKPIYYIDLDL
jgi:hypothetical protein